MKKLLIIISSFIFILLLVMTISDIYYSNLEKDYPILINALQVKGKITDYRVHWKHSYITLDDQQKIHVLPITHNEYPEKTFHNLIEVGDSLFKNEYSEKILVKKKGEEFVFDNQEKSGH